MTCSQCYSTLPAINVGRSNAIRHALTCSGTRLNKNFRGGGGGMILISATKIPTGYFNLHLVHDRVRKINVTQIALL